MIQSIRSVPVSDLMDVESKSFSDPWTEHVFGAVLSDFKNRGFVFKQDNKVCGFLIYRIGKKKLYVCNLAVAPEYRRSKIATLLMMKLLSKLTPERNKISVTVSENSLDSHLFLKACGFVAVKVLHKFFNEFDAYNFVYDQSDAFVSLDG